jgi:hypothetical protein
MGYGYLVWTVIRPNPLPSPSYHYVIGREFENRTTFIDLGGLIEAQLSCDLYLRLEKTTHAESKALPRLIKTIAISKGQPVLGAYCPKKSHINVADLKEKEEFSIKRADWTGKKPSNGHKPSAIIYPKSLVKARTGK